MSDVKRYKLVNGLLLGTHTLSDHELFTGNKDVVFASDYDALQAKAEAMAQALEAVENFRAEENEWDGVDVCMPEMRRIAQAALAAWRAK